MDKIELRTGDLFGTRNPMALGRGINTVQKVWSKDNKSVYSHSGLIENSKGVTYEALWTIKQSHLTNYLGKRVIIARALKDMLGCEITQETCQQALIEIKQRHHKQWYPWWRIPLHIIPPLAKYVSWFGKKVVCSELVAEFEYLIGVRHSQYTGTNPDMLADEWRKWKDFAIIGEGELRYDGKDFFISPV